jgi:hypothetical protein
VSAVNGGGGMSKSKAKRIQVDPLEGVDTHRPFPRLRLTTAQWSEVSKLSSIPNDSGDGRDAIERVLGMFREFQESELHRKAAAEIRREFHGLAKDARSFYERLSSLMSNRDAYTALIGGGALPSGPLNRLTNRAHHQGSVSSAGQQRLVQDAHRRLSQICDVLLRSPKWFLIAAYRVKDKKRGPKAENVYWLVGNLDGIREQYAGKKITRSYKDDDSVKYIKYVCEIADPSIGSGTIDKAMRFRIKNRK